MKKYMNEIKARFAAALEKDGSDLEKLRAELLVHIGFMQHERLIHLIVTVLFSLVLFICMAGLVCFEKIVFLPLVALVLCLLVPYIAHYFFLENNTQGLYALYDRYTEKIEGKDDVQD